MRCSGLVALTLLASSACGAASTPADPSLPLDTLRLAPGFAIEVFARAPGARSLALGPPGVVFVGTRGEGVVHALLDRDGDGRAETVREVASGLDTPNGVAFHRGALYVAERSRIVRLDGVAAWLEGKGERPRRSVVYDRLPRERGHDWKVLRAGPDGKLYVPVGAPCNVCLREDPFATIARLDPDGRNFEVVARGVRNSVGVDWHPRTRELWFTDNGRDMLGDDVPADELNRLSQPGQHFGFPYCHEGRVADPRYGSRAPCSDFVAPVHRFGAHVAALGMRFAAGPRVPAALRGRIVVAQHGSWNRSTPVGYRVVVVDPEGEARETVLAEGWLRGRAAWGRPVDVEFLPDGSLLVSDDEAGVVYRIAGK
jgi:glucose/arabinose dehydrogenase